MSYCPDEDIDDYCMSCGDFINQSITGEPCLVHRDLLLCSRCALDIIEPIYKLEGTGCFQPLIFRDMLASSYYKKRRSVIKDYKRIFKELLYRYKFQCVACGEKDEKKLTIDHIKPVSKGGGDEIANLQIMCKSCNSRKGAKYDKD